MIVAVVLSAGESSRMGRPKALLPIDGQTFIERIVAALKQTKVGKIIVILGHNARELQSKISHLPVEILINTDYKLGQLSSLQLAVRHLQPDLDCDGMLVHLVDHPYLAPALVEEMIRRFYETKKRIIVPKFHGKRGHPVIFSNALFDEILSAPMEEGAKAVVNAHRAETLEIETEEEGIAVDIDTPELYQQHVRRA
ncbi:MAG TPA: nucleotidyltransferase family protein [Candidatus Binatia bacterium]|nr:nucleotidyltransferase family protein [Candidatus Binatia bacterium]